ncbi:MAG: hypothetical protein Q7S61_04500 [bacterium]|nr:hypothetical protein [bacterium]
MIKKRKEKKMTSFNFVQTNSEFSIYDFGSISAKDVIFESPINTHEDIPEFQFAPLDEVKKDLLDSGHSSEEVEEVIAGLSELPEYAKSRRIAKSKKTN